MLCKIEDYVALHAKETPGKVAVVDHGSTYTYAELWRMVEDEAHRLQCRGTEEGTCVFFHTTQNVSFLVSYMAIHLVGAVAAPLGSDVSEEELEGLCHRYSSVRLSGDIADVLFTTGTTGGQKGVMCSRRALLADADNLIDAQGFCADTVFVIAGPLNHIGSLSKMWPVWMEGGTLILLDGMRDLDAFFHAFDYPGTEMATFLVPTAIEMVLRFGRDRMALLADRIDFIETGAAPISKMCMEELCQTLPHSRLYNTYASTETGIVCTHDFGHGTRDPHCLGWPIKHATLRITTEGRIACKGDMMMSGYIGNDMLTRERMRDGWIVTEDMGEIDAEGRLLFKGRSGEIINIGGYKVSPMEVEQAARNIEGIEDCVCVAAESPLLGRTLKLIYSTTTGEALPKTMIARTLAQKLERYKVPMLYEHVARLHYTFNGKIDRKYYHALVQS